MSFAFERLLVYQKSVDFADAICATTEEFQRGYGLLVDQLNRAAPGSLLCVFAPLREPILPVA
jgi:hypothetical protein